MDKDTAETVDKLLIELSEYETEAAITIATYILGYFTGRRDESAWRDELEEQD